VYIHFILKECRSGCEKNIAYHLQSFSSQAHSLVFSDEEEQE